MGIRFLCHHCREPMHVKDFQAGKRGRCPKCQGPFRIPESDTDFSLPIQREKSPSGDSQENQSEADAAMPAPSTTAAMPHLQSVGEGLREAPSSEVLDRAAGASKDPSIPGRESIVQEMHSDRSIGTDHSLIDCPKHLPLLLRQSSEHAWYVRPSSGGQYGPATAEVFGQWLSENRIANDSLVWREDWASWQPASQAFSDYFEVDSQQLVELAGNQPPSVDQQAQLAAVSPTTAHQSYAPKPLREGVPSDPFETELGSPAMGSRKQRRRQTKRTQTVTIVILSIVLVWLLAILAFVLTRSGNREPTPAAKFEIVIGPPAFG